MIKGVFTLVLSTLVAGVSLATAAASKEQTLVVRLGVHRFGTASSGMVVARAAASQVGWQLPNGDSSAFGPQTFLVGRDRSIWLDDGLNNRLLVWPAGRPGKIARSVPLPFANADSNVALGPGGSIYTTRTLGNGMQHNYRLVLDRQTATGKLLWETRLSTVGGEFCGDLRTGPDRTLYCVGPHETWRPVATPSGAPIPLAEQRRRGGAQPIAGGLRLVAALHGSRELRVSLLRGRSTVRTWRVLSRSAIVGFHRPEAVGSDPVVVLDFQNTKTRPVKWDYVALRLGRNGLVAKVTMRHAVYGDNLLPDVRVGPDGAFYRLASSPRTGVVIARYSLGR